LRRHDEQAQAQRNAWFDEAMLYNASLMTLIFSFGAKQGYLWEGFAGGAAFAFVIWCRATYLYVRVW
jgi:predicted lysophospholipase L1 biosynthesis ABC-type transport system permease subunit